ncbi:hypothetical protein HaLaN_29112, partial [Haematococcus lacustris]
RLAVCGTVPSSRPGLLACHVWVWAAGWPALSLPLIAYARSASEEMILFPVKCEVVRSRTWAG